jgi:hypothetical protein
MGAFPFSNNCLSGGSSPWLSKRMLYHRKSRRLALHYCAYPTTGRRFGIVFEPHIQQAANLSLAHKLASDAWHLKNPRL